MSPTDERLWPLERAHEGKLRDAGIPLVWEGPAGATLSVPPSGSNARLLVPEWVLRTITAIRTGSAVTARAADPVYVKALRALDNDPELRAAMMALYLTLPLRSGRHAALYEFLAAKGVL